MEIKVKNDTFYVLEAGNEKRIYDAESSAVESLKTLLLENKDLNEISQSTGGYRTTSIL